MIKLTDDVSMPQLGLGVFKVRHDDDAAAAVSTAIEAGYRSIDTAAYYRNERGIGRAVRESGVAREDLFVTTKLWNTDHGHDAALRAFDVSMEKLGLDYLDLYLIHWPVPARDERVPAWRALEKIHAEGRVRAIGVSNFNERRLAEIHDACGVWPVINQVELTPWLDQAALREFHDAHGIVTESWSPLGQGALLDDPVLTSIAARHGKTAAQVILRWNIQLGIVVIPKSVTPSRIRENIDVFDFELTPEDLAAIATLNCGRRTGPNPEEGF